MQSALAGRAREYHKVACTKEAVTLANGMVIQPGTVGCRQFEWHGIN